MPPQSEKKLRPKWFKQRCLEVWIWLDFDASKNMYMYFINWLFLQDVRVSDTEPRIFYMEEFGFRTQFSLPLILNNNTSLAQCLQTGYLIAQVWHQSLKGSHMYYCSASYLHWVVTFYVYAYCSATYLPWLVTFYLLRVSITVEPTLKTNRSIILGHVSSCKWWTNSFGDLYG